MHKCLTCDNYTPFPRYNDVNILLITRKGRCGEWANTFTLFSCAMGWDARFVVDKSDHVWTEVILKLFFNNIIVKRHFRFTPSLRNDGFIVILAKTSVILL